MFSMMEAARLEALHLAEDPASGLKAVIAIHNTRFGPALGGCRYLAYACLLYTSDCAKVALELSQAERKSRSRSYLQPEISLLRGQCLERESLFVDAAQTYQFIITRYPASEYAYRARARLQTLEQLGHHSSAPAAKVSPCLLYTSRCV